MKNTTDFNGNGSGTMKPFDRLSRWTLSQRVDTQTKARPRQDNRKRKFTFFALTLFKKKKNKKELPPLNFSSRFLSHAPFSTFANRASWFVGKFAKELKPTRKAKSRAKKPALYTKNLVNLKIKHHKL